MLKDSGVEHADALARPRSTRGGRTPPAGDALLSLRPADDPGLEPGVAGSEFALFFSPRASSLAYRTFVSEITEQTSERGREDRGVTSPSSSLSEFVCTSTPVGAPSISTGTTGTAGTSPLVFPRAGSSPWLLPASGGASADMSRLPSIAPRWSDTADNLRDPMGLTYPTLSCSGIPSQSCPRDRLSSRGRGLLRRILALGATGLR